MTDAIDPVFVRHIKPHNLLSFGSGNPGIGLQPLNVFIGPNASGKSNLIEAISLMRSTPRDLREVTRKGGGVSEWICKANPSAPASVEWVVRHPSGDTPLRHSLSFHAVAHSFTLDDERVEEFEKRFPNETDVYFYYRYQHGRPVMNKDDAGERLLPPGSIDPTLSILAQRHDPESYPELSYLASSYGRIRIYREWTFGRNAVFREPQRADMRNDILEEDFSNLGLFLNRLKTRFPAARKAMLDGLRDLYAGFADFDILVEGGTVQVFFTEAGFSFPATRLSDGTLRYLCLLAILCDPEPPPLLCIEEPELGLHPDILPNLAQLLRQASQRAQILVTTHSDILVDAMSDTPESVIVCSKSGGLSQMNRLDRASLAGWLEKYRLGQLWTMGEIGGNRW
jgi:predicted ATPase